MTLCSNDHHNIFATMPKNIYETELAIIFRLYLIRKLIIFEIAMKNKFHLKVMRDTTCHSLNSNPEHNPDFLLRRFLQFDSRR